MANTEWETPQDFFDALNREFRFDIDVCALPQNAKCKNFYSPDDDGLKQPWRGRCWMNPPYDRSIGEWLKKAYETAQNGHLVVALIQGRSTDTIAWHNYVMKSNEIRFIKDRLHFGMNGEFKRANISSVVVIFGPFCQGPPRTRAIDTLGNELSN